MPLICSICILMHKFYFIFIQACKDPSVTLVEYAKPVTLNTPETAIPSSQTSEPLSTKAAANSNICQHIDLLQDKIVTYIMLLKGSQAIEAKREQCLKLIKNFKHQASKSSNIFYFVAYPEQSCQTNAPDIKLKAKLNLKALKYVSLSKVSYSYSCIEILYCFTIGMYNERTANICYFMKVAVKLDDQQVMQTCLHQLCLLIF